MSGIPARLIQNHCGAFNLLALSMNQEAFADESRFARTHISRHLDSMSAFISTTRKAFNTGATEGCMSQVSIPCVAHFPLEGWPDRVDPSLLTSAVKIPPELYLDDEHHRSIYCPGCGVMCSRIPRKKARRKDNVHAFYAHSRGFDDVGCPHRKPGGSAGADAIGKEKKAINLATFAGWKSLDDDEAEDEEVGQVSKSKRVVQGGTAGNGRGVELVFDGRGNLLNAGEFHTVGRLVTLAKTSLDISVQFADQEATRLRDLIVWVEKVQKDSRQYIGKSFLFVGQPTLIYSGRLHVFFNFMNAEHNLVAYCDPRVFERWGWKTSERDHYYIFYGLLERNKSDSLVRILYSGQIDRLPSPAHDLFNSLR